MSTQRDKPRQVIFIMTDTQRIDMLGCYGNTDMKTPCLDSLAAQGMRFDRAYTCQPVCGPARSALFTGTFPHSNGSWANSIALTDNVKTIGQRLTDSGVHCAYIGKWHLDGGDYFGMGRCPEGWDVDYWYDMRNYLEELPVDIRPWTRDMKTNRDPSLTEDITFGHRCANRAIDFVSRHKDEDFFLVLSFDEPHGPSLCPEPYASMYSDYTFPRNANVSDTLEGKPSHQKAWAGDRIHGNRDQVQISAPDFFGCNSFVDYEIGRVVQAIDANARDSLVIYTADHGDMLESHCLTGKGPASYDEITRVPFIVRWPEVVTPNSVCNHPTSHIDVVPTVLEVFDHPLPKLLEGSSMLPTLENSEVKTNDSIYIEFTRYEIDHDGFGGYQPLRTVFDGRYKLTINLMSEDELYDLHKDPAEMANLIESSEHSEIRDTLHNRILDWMNETRDPFRGYYWERRPWRVDAASPTWAYTGKTRQREHEEYEPRQMDYDTGLEMKEAIRQK